MVQKAEKICAEIESNKAKAEAKYGLKGLLLHFAHTLNKEKTRDKLEGDDKETRLQCRRLWSG